MRTMAIVLVAFGLAADAVHAQSGAVRNGGFEEPDVGSYEFFADAIPGWTVGSGRIEVIDQSYGNGFRARSGTQFLAFNEPAAVHQDVPTIPDRRFRLVFHIDREIDATGPTTVTVSAGGTHREFVIPLEQHDYRRETVEFMGTPNADVTRITFTSTNSTEAGPVVDDVTIEEVDGP